MEYLLFLLWISIISILVYRVIMARRALRKTMKSNKR